MDADNDNDNDEISNLKSICFWFYNPLTIAISSRGNAESLMAFIVLLFLYVLLRKNYLIAGLLFSFAIHFKIYPITYSLAILFYILFDTSSSSSSKSANNTSKIKRNKTILNIFELNQVVCLLKFGFTFLIGITSLTYYFYKK